MNEEIVLKDFLNSAEKQGHKVLYLIKSGSHLYGTNTETSDTDYKGLFLPDTRSALFGDAPRHLSHKTGTNDSKNTSEDVDIELFSIQYFLKQLAKGETNAVDILYSYTHEDCVLMRDAALDRMFRNHDKLFDVRNCNAYVGYAIGQAKKYGVKGSRLGVIKKVHEWVSDCAFDPFSTLGEWAEGIIQDCGDDSYCFKKELKTGDGSLRPYLVLCGSKHEYGIRMDEFIDRVNKAYTTYGERAKAAMNNEGVDWKALSHAIRAINQMEELLLTGSLEFPLKSAVHLLRVKSGMFSWPTVENMILEGLEKIQSLIDSGKGSNNKYDAGFAKAFVYSLYNWV